MLDDEEASYIRAEEKKFKNILLAAEKKRVESHPTNSDVPVGTVWTSMSDLGLIYCLTVDVVKEGYLTW